MSEARDPIPNIINFQWYILTIVNLFLKLDRAANPLFQNYSEMPWNIYMPFYKIETCSPRWFMFSFINLPALGASL